MDDLTDTREQYLAEHFVSWAERECPKWSDEQWSYARWVSGQQPGSSHRIPDGMESLGYAEAAAALAHIRRLAEGLDAAGPYTVNTFLRWCRPDTPKAGDASVLDHCKALGLLGEDMQPTPRGRAVARYLEGQNG